MAALQWKCEDPLSKRCFFLRDEEQNAYSQGVKLKLRLLVERDEQTGRWSAMFPELPGCASAGDTETEAIANAREALELWFEPSPIPTPRHAKWVELTVS